MAEDTWRYLDPQARTKLNALALLPRGVVEGEMAGLRRSSRTGFAVEFAGHRDYVPGDDGRHIDWKVFFRTDRLYLRQYHEETRLNLYILLDTSSSMAYGKPNATKLDHAMRLAMALAYVAVQQGDAAAMACYGDSVGQYEPPGSTPATLARFQWMLDRQRTEAMEAKREPTVADVRKAVLALSQQFGRNRMVAVVSDLIMDDLGQFELAIQHLRNAGHEVIAFQVLHRDELEFTFKDPCRFVGMETPARLATHPPSIRDTYLERLRAYLDDVRSKCKAVNVDHVLVNTAYPAWAILREYLLEGRR